MDIFPLRRTESQLLANNPYWEYRRDSYQLRDGSQRPYYYVHTNGSVMVIPITDDGRLVLVRQFRYLWQQESIEFPGGGIPSGISSADQAHRELQEEAGLTATTMILLGEFNPMNGVTDERCSVYLARGLSEVAKVNDPAEETDTLVMDETEFNARIADGTIWDGMTLAAWALLSAQRLR